MTAGKGDKQRPTDKKKFDENWDKIFKKRRERERNDKYYIILEQTY